MATSSGTGSGRRRSRTAAPVEKIHASLGALPHGGPTTEVAMYLAAILRAQAAMIAELRELHEALAPEKQAAPKRARKTGS